MGACIDDTITFGIFATEIIGVQKLIIESLSYIFIALMLFWTVWGTFFKA